MKRFITLATVLLVGLASVQAAQTDDQQKKKKKKQAQTTTQAAPAPKKGGTQTSNRRVSSQTTTKPQVSAQTNKPHASAQTNKPHVTSQPSSNQQATNRYYKNKKGQSNVQANTNYNQRNTQVVQTKKSKNQNYVVTNNNAQWNKKAWKHYKRTGNEWSYSAAQRWNWRQRHDRDWWRHSNYRLVRYGGGYWYWNSGWWYPAYGYDPYYSHYVYDGPIFGYGYAAPGDVTAQVQQSLAQQGYYYGPIDGILGPGTRSAIQRYQIDHGLAVTATIDEQTLATLGMT